MIAIARSTAWAASFAIVLLTVVPPTLRPVSAVPHSLEHFTIFLLVGCAFALGYSRNIVSIAVLALPCIAGAELLQLFVLGRHARVGDFVVNLVGFYVGAALVCLLARVGRTVRYDR